MFVDDSGKAEAILGIMDRQTYTDPTFSDLLKLMGLRSGLKDEYLYMEEELNYFLQYDMEFVNEADFYEELSILGKARGKAVDSALSQSMERRTVLLSPRTPLSPTRTRKKMERRTALLSPTRM